MMSKQVKSCPFCGAEANVKWEHTGKLPNYGTYVLEVRNYKSCFLVARLKNSINMAVCSPNKKKLIEA